MTKPTFPPYAPRPIRFQELWTIGEITLKAYAIALPGARVSPRIWLAARETVEDSLKAHPIARRMHGAGFVTVQEASGKGRVNLDLWIEEYELLHRAWSCPEEGPFELHPAPDDHGVMSLWEAYVVAFERHAWIAYMLNNPDGPDPESYFTARLDADV